MDEGTGPLARRRAVIAAGLGGLLLSACGLPRLQPAPRPPSPTLAATPVPTPLPAPTPLPLDTFQSLIHPFAEEATTRRAARRAADPTYDRRVDPELSDGRINFGILGYGPTYEPPFRDQIGSPTVLSLNLSQRLIDLVSLTHDLRAPEIERYQGAHGAPPDPTKIDQAYWRGGFDLNRLVMEDATGIALDFQITIDDQAILAFVDDVLGHLDVDVPVSLDTAPYELGQQMYPGSHFAAGPQAMTGQRVLEYMKSIETVHDISAERNVRKSVVFGALFSFIQQHATDPFFWLHTIDFVNQQTAQKRITADFDVGRLVTGNLNQVARGMISFATRGDHANVMPKLNRSVYVVDRTSGDGGSEWVSLSDNPIVWQDLDLKKYPNLSFQVPLQSNPYAIDLPDDYWWSTRRRIKEIVLGIEPPAFAAKERRMVEG
ncbi:MAG TPA: LCP family protein [Chloroflexota bacterium]|nr:LCP family protein [Chloroflexota bacterium]